MNVRQAKQFLAGNPKLRGDPSQEWDSDSNKVQNAVKLRFRELASMLFSVSEKSREWAKVNYELTQLAAKGDLAGMLKVVKDHFTLGELSHGLWKNLKEELQEGISEVGPKVPPITPKE